MSHQVPLSLALVLSIYAVLAWSAQRRMLRRQEILPVAGSFLFFAAMLLFRAAAAATRPLYGDRLWPHIGISLALVVPPLAAMGYGAYAIARAQSARGIATVSLGNLTVRVMVGSLIAAAETIDAEALVVPAGRELWMRGGLAAAIRNAAGVQVERESRAKAPAGLGQTVLTGAGRLTAKHIIHAVVTGRPGEVDAKVLERAVGNVLKAARKAHARRLALPAFGVAKGPLAAEPVATGVVRAISGSRKDFDEIAIVAASRKIAATYAAQLDRILKDTGAGSVSTDNSRISLTEI